MVIGNTINSIVSISDQKYFFGTYRGISQYTPSMNAGMVNISSVTTPQNKYYINKDDNDVSTQTDFRVRFSFNAQTTIRYKKNKSIDIELLVMMKIGANHLKVMS